jgi:hypothetical protein
VESRFELSRIQIEWVAWQKLIFGDSLLYGVLTQPRIKFSCSSPCLFLLVFFNGVFLLNLSYAAKPLLEITRPPTFRPPSLDAFSVFLLHLRLDCIVFFATRVLNKLLALVA